MKRLFSLSASLIALSILAGCDNEIDINAPWRETPVVYGFLDPNSSTQYLRIEKTYQNSITQTTEQGAKINDSLYFDNIVVKVKSANLPTVVFTKTTEIPKETGYFSSGTHYLYKGTLQPIAGRSYTLEMYSPKTGNTYLSTTTCIGTSDIATAVFNFGRENSPIVLTVTPMAGAKDVSTTLRFKYLEYTTSKADADTFTVDYLIDKDPSTSGSNLLYSINNRVLVNYIKDFIQVKAGFTREIIGFDLYDIGGGQEITDLMNIMKPSAMVVQKKMEYSNISGGLGIFSSRSVNFDANIQTRPESNWGNPTGKKELVKLLNGEGVAINPADLNFIE